MRIDADSHTAAIARQCAQRPDVQPYARIVGQWVWIEFPGDPSADTKAFIKELGFRWNGYRKAWQHSCGVFSRFKPRAKPKKYYGCQPIEGLLSEVRA